MVFYLVADLAERVKSTRSALFLRCVVASARMYTLAHLVRI